MATIHKMQVGKKVADGKGGNTTVTVGSVDITVFDLSDFDPSLPKADQTSQQGEPEYVNPKIQAIQDAITAMLKADARNKLQKGSVSLLSGKSIATTVDEFLEKSERSGAAMALAKAFADDFTAYLAARSGKKAIVQDIYSKLVRSKAGIALATASYRAGLLSQLVDFQGGLDAVRVLRYDGLFEMFNTLCNAEVESYDEDDA